MLHALAHAQLEPVGGRAVIHATLRQVRLRHEVLLAEIVRVLVLRRLFRHPAQAGELLARRRGQMIRHGQSLALAHVSQGFIDSHVCGVALRRRRHVDRRVSQRDPRLGHAHHLRGARGIHRHAEGIRIRQAHILAGADDDAPGDEADILSGIQHEGQPIERRIGVAAAHRLDEGRNRIVVPVARAIVANGLFLDALLGHRQRHVHHAGLGGRRRERGHFERRQGLAHVAVRLEGEVSQRLFIDLQAHGPQPALLIGDGAAQQGRHGFVGHGLEGENLRAREHGRVDGEVGVLRRRADEAHRALLEMRQQHVLLRLVEAVQLVDKEDGALPVQAHSRARLRNLLADLAHVALHAVQGDEVGACLARDHVGQRRLAHAGRAVKDEGGEAIRLDGAAQQLTGREQVQLPGDFIERLRAHASRQRHRRQGGGRSRRHRASGGGRTIRMRREEIHLIHKRALRKRTSETIHGAAELVADHGVARAQRFKRLFEVGDAQAGFVVELAIGRHAHQQKIL